MVPLSANADTEIFLFVPIDACVTRAFLCSEIGEQITIKSEK